MISQYWLSLLLLFSLFDISNQVEISQELSSQDFSLSKSLEAQLVFEEILSQSAAKKHPLATGLVNPIEYQITYGDGCTTLSDCPVDNHHFYECVDSNCIHKPVFPGYFLEWFGAIIYGFIMALCNVAGIGGGGITQPIIQAFFRFPIKETIAISMFTIVTSTLFRYIYQIKQKNPLKPTVVLVDYGLTSIMMPATLAGTQIGSQLILKSFPGILIQILLECLLGFLTWNAYEKAKKLTKKEDEAAERAQQDEGTLEEDKNIAENQLAKLNSINSEEDQEDDSKNPEALFLIDNGQECLEINDKKYYLSAEDQILNSELRAVSEIAKSEQGHLQWKKQGIIAIVVVFQIYMNLTMGSVYTASIIGTKVCGAYYWIIQVVFVGLCVAMTYLAIKLNTKEYYLRQKFVVNFTSSDLDYSNFSTTKLLIGISFFGGLVAGALGLGGGSIYGPALLHLGVDPRVAGATGMYLVLWGAINACVINLIGGTLDLRYGTWLGFWSVVGAAIGLVLTEKAVKKTGRPSIFVWILVGVFGLSALITPIFGYYQTKLLKEAGFSPWTFHSPCEL